MGKQLEYALDVIQAGGELRQHQAKKDIRTLGFISLIMLLVGIAGMLM